MASDEAAFHYSASLYALIYVSNQVYSYCGSEKYHEIMDSLCAGAQADLTAQSHYWKKYETVVADVSNGINNAYLTSNGLKDGTHSYGRFVDLLLAYFRD